MQAHLRGSAAAGRASRRHPLACLDGQDWDRLIGSDQSCRSCSHRAHPQGATWDRERALFPSRDDPQKPIPRHLADGWLRKAEKLAGLETQKGSLWRAYRRKWATERKHLPDVDVAAAGGWKTVQTLKTAYQQADAETMLRVVLEAGQLRGAK
jgi:integrase